MEHKPLHTVTYLLIVVGALNWGLVGLFDVNLVASLLGDGSMSEKVVYILVGLSAVVDLMMHMSYCKMCGSKK